MLTITDERCREIAALIQAELVDDEPLDTLDDIESDIRAGDVPVDVLLAVIGALLDKQAVRVTSDGYRYWDQPDLLAAIRWAEAELQEEIGDPAEDLDFVCPQLHWSLGWVGDARTRLHLWADGERTNIHIDPIPVGGAR